MQTFRKQAGFTLIEIMTVVAIVGILSALGISALRSYGRHEDTRRAALAVANAITKARSEAAASGRMTFVLFAAPTDGTIPFAPGQFAAMVVDQDDDKKVGAADAVTPIFLPNGTGANVSAYGAQGQTSMKDTVLPSADESAQIPDGSLSALNDGTTIPVDATLGVPVLAFAPQGMPVTIADPSNWGTGAGGVYLTDNDQMVLAVVVEPLGDVRTFAYDNASGKWK